MRHGVGIGRTGWRIATVIICVSSLAACGSDVSAVATTRYVDASARASCVVTQNVYASEDDQRKAFEDELAKAEISPEEREKLDSRKEDSSTFRRRISARFDEICGPTASDSTASSTTVPAEG
jgi:hypothetical protein